MSKIKPPYYIYIMNNFTENKSFIKLRYSIKFYSILVLYAVVNKLFETKYSSNTKYTLVKMHITGITSELCFFEFSSSMRRVSMI